MKEIRVPISNQRRGMVSVLSDRDEQDLTRALHDEGRSELGGAALSGRRLFSLTSWAKAIVPYIRLARRVGSVGTWDR